VILPGTVPEILSTNTLVMVVASVMKTTMGQTAMTAVRDVPEVLVFLRLSQHLIVVSMLSATGLIATANTYKATAPAVNLLITVEMDILIQAITVL